MEPEDCNEKASCVGGGQSFEDALKLIDRVSGGVYCTVSRPRRRGGMVKPMQNPPGIENQRRNTIDKLAEIAQKQQAAHQQFISFGSKVYEKFMEMERAIFTDGALPKKAKELIALGISVHVNCESCIKWHIEQAASSGAGLREILEAVEVGIGMGGGPAGASATFALEVLAKLFPHGS